MRTKRLALGEYSFYLLQPLHSCIKGFLSSYFLLKNESKLQHVRLLIWAAFLSGTVYIMASDILIIAQRFSAYFAAVIPLAMAYVMQRRSIRNDAFFLTVLVSLLNFASLFYYYGPGFRFF